MLWLIHTVAFTIGNTASVITQIMKSLTQPQIQLQFKTLKRTIKKPSTGGRDTERELKRIPLKALVIGREPSFPQRFSPTNRSESSLNTYKTHNLMPIGNHMATSSTGGMFPNDLNRSGIWMNAAVSLKWTVKKKSRDT